MVGAMRTPILPICIAVLLLTSTWARADGTLLFWGPKDIEGMTEKKWNAAKTQTVDQVLALNLHAKTWGDVYSVVLGGRSHLNDIALRDGLVAQLTDPTVIKLSGTRRLIIWERIAKGDILFEGIGMQIDDDLFSVAGRANWALHQIYKKKYGTVRPGATAKSLQLLQEKWHNSFAGKTVPEVQQRYPSPSKGLTELRSKAAIVALIASLKDSKKKQEYTQYCLKTFYQIDSLPPAPHAARTCSPDLLAQEYLESITNVTGRHDFLWWMHWCRKYLALLQWNPETAKFQTPLAEQ